MLRIIDANVRCQGWLLRTSAKNAKSTLYQSRRSQRLSTQAKSTLMKPWDRHKPDSCDIGQIPEVHADPNKSLVFQSQRVERSQGSKLYAMMCSAATNFDLANLS